MQKIYIVGNWKMHLSYQESTELLQGIIADYKPHLKIELVIAPQFPMLFALAKIAKNTDIKIASQNCASEISGAYTGEVSPILLQEVCNYCILGHSERRNIFKESTTEIVKKFFLIQKYQIKSIFCVGETLEQRASGKLEEVLTQQLMPILTTESKDFLIAYEPVWAIGTGKVADVEQIAQVHQFIFELLNKKLSAQVVQNIPILYGGSVKPSNAQDLLAINNVNGLLIGGASLKKDDLLAIINSSMQ